MMNANYLHSNILTGNPLEGFANNVNSIRYERIDQLNINSKIAKELESLEERSLTGTTRNSHLKQSFPLRLSNATVFIARSSEGQILGYTSVLWKDEAPARIMEAHPSLKIESPIAFESGGFVDARFQGLGIYNTLALARFKEINARKCNYVIVRTQNPVVELTHQKCFKELFGEKAKACELLRIVDQQGVGSRVSETPKVNCNDSSNWPDSYNKLNIELGDVFFLIWKLPKDC